MGILCRWRRRYNSHECSGSGAQTSTLLLLDRCESNLSWRFEPIRRQLRDQRIRHRTCIVNIIEGLRYQRSESVHNALTSSGPCSSRGEDCIETRSELTRNSCDMVSLTNKNQSPKSSRNRVAKPGEQ